MLGNIPKNGEGIFSRYKSLRSLSCTFKMHRKRFPFNLGNPRLFRISFRKIRHWKVTMEHHRSKDILHVMQLLGHRNINNTLIYTQSIHSDGDEYVCKVAKTVEQAAELIEAGLDTYAKLKALNCLRRGSKLVPMPCQNNGAVAGI